MFSRFARLVRPLESELRQSVDAIVSFWSDAWVSGADRLVNAAIARLARGDGKGGLRDLGIDRSEVIRDARVGTGVIYNHFDRGNGVVRGLADEVLARLMQDQKRLEERGAAGFHRYRADASGGGGVGRALFAQAIGDLEQQHGALPDADELAKARERTYYLSAALCDAATNDSQAPISPEQDEIRTDVRFRRHLAEAQVSRRRVIVEICQVLLAESGREPILGAERLELDG